jgi:hypothetical protein
VTLCMQVRTGEGGIIAHLGSPEDWQLILSRAARVHRLSDVLMGPYSGLYQVVDNSNQCRQYLVQEPAPGAWAGEMSRPVRVGSTVRVREGESEETWRVVGCEEADPMRGCISEDSPLGRSLLGHVAGDVVTVRGPEGCWSARVVAVD